MEEKKFLYVRDREHMQRHIDHAAILKNSEIVQLFFGEWDTIDLDHQGESVILHATFFCSRQAFLRIADVIAETAQEVRLEEEMKKS